MNIKKKMMILLFLFLISLYITYTLLSSKQEPVIAQENSDLVKLDSSVETLFKVDIKGAVLNPGVYELSNDSRIIDAIELAGGLLEDANTDYLNLSKKIEDGTVIFVYTNSEMEELMEAKTIVEYVEKECNCPDVINSACMGTTSSSKVNINSATLEELMTLSGIGESKAQAIIEYRETNLFMTIEDIKNVSGIGDSAYEKIKDFITV